MAINALKGKEYGEAEKKDLTSDAYSATFRYCTQNVGHL